MKTVTIHEAKTHLSRFIRDVEAGEEIIIARGKKPLARLVPIEPVMYERKSGGAPGLVVYMAEDFDKTPDDFSGYMP